MCTRIELLGVAIDPLGMDQVVGQIQAWIAAGEPKCRYVVTPNVDQIVLLQHDAGLQAAYARAGLILADGAPLVWASHLLPKPLPGRVAGADLVPALFDAAQEEQPTSVFLLGGDPGVAERAAAKIHQRWPGIRVAGTYSPPPGFDKNHAESLRILTRIAAVKPDVLIVGLGAPQQELWVHQYQTQIQARVALCVGATIDILAGEQPRTPAWMRDLGLEWLHRVLSEPRRLAARYLRDAWIFPQIVARQWWNQPRGPARVRL